MKNSYWIVILLLSVCVVLSGRAIIDKSATFDESMLVITGYSYWKTGDFRMDPNNPPLAKLIVSVPLLFTNFATDKWSHYVTNSSWQEKDSYRFAQETLYPNTPDESGNYKDDINIILARIPNLILAVLLGFVLWYCSRKWWGDIAGVATLGFYVFCPNILAYSSLATTDLPLTVFFFLSALTIFNLLQDATNKWPPYVGRGFSLTNSNLKWFGLCVISLFFALGTKSSAMIILPVSFLYSCILLYKKKSLSELKKPLMFLIFVWVIVLIVIFVFPPMRKSFVQSLDMRWFQLWQGQHPTFLAGQYSLTGWWYYFLVALFVKTPLPVLVLFISSIIYFCEIMIVSTSPQPSPVKGEGQDDKIIQKFWFCIIPILCFFIVGAVSKKQIGLRYILPIYPFIYLLIGHISTKLWTNLFPMGEKIKVSGNITKILVSVLLLWQVAGTISVSPHYLAYFNELAGGSNNGYKLLVDSNLDWGQDLKGLAKYLREQNNPELVLSYFGTVPPDYYGIKAQDLGSQPTLRASCINSIKPVRELLAVSATNLQGVYYRDHKTFDWLKKYKPITKIGYSIFVYDITNDAWAHVQMGRLYLQHQNKVLALRECRRVIDLFPDKDKSLGYYNLAKTYEIFGNKDLANKYFQKAKLLKFK